MTDERWFGQFEEDRYINELLPEPSGCYVDVGAYHPTRYSNTAVLHARGWRGMNVDLSPVTIARFDAARPDDVNVCCAVGASCGTVEAFVFGDGAAPIHTIDNPTADRWKDKFHTTYVRREVECHSLDCLLSTMPVLTGIDLLNVDVEGAELDVLAGFSLAKWAPRVVAIEVHLDRGTELADAPVVTALAAAGYRLRHFAGVTAVLTRQDLP